MCPVEGNLGLPEVILDDVIGRDFQYAAPVLVEDPGSAVICEAMGYRVQALSARADSGLGERIQMMNP